MPLRQPGNCFCRVQVGSGRYLHVYPRLTVAGIAALHEERDGVGVRQTNAGVEIVRRYSARDDLLPALLEACFERVEQGGSDAHATTRVAHAEA